MSPEIIGIVGLLILFFLIFIRVPIGIAMAATGYAGACYLLGWKAGTAILGISPFDTASSYFFSVIPLFVLMGMFTFYAGLSTEAYYTVRAWVGHLSGGVAMASIGACAGFAAVCGSTFATAATIGRLALPEMRRYNYDPKLATGCIAAGGTLGILIPPSTSFIIYGLVTEQSISKLFIAGILPGLLLTGLFMITIYIITKKDPNLGPSASKTNWKEKGKAIKNSWAMVILFILVIGGIWSGIFTPTEAAAIGAFAAFILTLIKRRLTKEVVIESLRGTAKTTGMIFFLIVGAMIFNYFVALTRLPMVLADFVSTLPLTRYGVLVVIIFIYIILGCIMDTLAMLLLTLPIIFPTIVALGFDPIWFGVIITLLVEIALITPPIGMNVYVIGGIAPDVPLSDIFRGIAPFSLALLICLILLIIFPQIALFLPGTTG
jgi:tripartite ATP-independent transporter DctM subunit